MNISTVKISFIGFLSGALGLLSLVLCLYLGLLIFGLTFAIPSTLIEANVTDTLSEESDFSTLLIDSLRTSGRNLVQGVWRLRWIYALTGVLGLFAAWAHRLGTIVRPRYVSRFSFAVMALIVTVSALTWIFVQAEVAAAHLAEYPELYRTWRDFLVGISTSDIGIAIIFSILATYPLWTSWHWWYQRLIGWFGLGSLLKATQTSPRTKHLQLPDDLRRRLLKTASLILIASLGLFVLISLYHSRISLRLQHGVAVLHADQAEGTRNGPRQIVAVDLEADMQRIRIVNINGTGTVSIFLSPSDTNEPTNNIIEDWSFRWRDNEYLYEDIPLPELAPRRYYLHFVQHDGWGMFEYIVSQGGGNLSNTMALLSGFFLASSLILGLALLALGPARRLVGI